MIPYGRHCIEQDDVDSVVSVLLGDWLTTGPTVQGFEYALRARLGGVVHVLACSSGTTALHLAMIGLQIQENDIVFVPAVTFVASANAARYVGAHVYFVDINPKSGLMDGYHLEEAILKHQQSPIGRPRAVVNVHLAGQCSNLKDIMQIAKKYDLYVIEDAAHAIGTIFNDKHHDYSIGSCDFCDVTIFSFHPVKTIAMGEGGAVSTLKESVFQRILHYRNHGITRNPSLWYGILSEKGPWYYEMQDLGYNYRVSDIQAALGLSQLKKLDHFINERKRLVENYDKHFQDSKILRPLKRMLCSRTAWHLYIVLIDFLKIKKNRTDVMKNLLDAGIGSQVHYIPLYYHPYYKNLYKDNFLLPGAELYYKQCLSLPLYVGLSDKQQNYIIQVLKKILFT